MYWLAAYLFHRALVGLSPQRVPTGKFACWDVGHGPKRHAQGAFNDFLIRHWIETLDDKPSRLYRVWAPRAEFIENFVVALLRRQPAILGVHQLIEKLEQSLSGKLGRHGYCCGIEVRSIRHSIASAVNMTSLDAPAPGQLIRRTVINSVHFVVYAGVRLSLFITQRRRSPRLPTLPTVTDPRP